MKIFQDFENDTQKMVVGYDHECISLLAFIAQQPIQTITDLESTTKIVFTIISKLYQNKFYDKFIYMLHNLKTHDYIQVSEAFKISVRDKFIFKLLLFFSLKYRKSMFIQTEETQLYVQIILREILQSISITNYESSCLIRLVEMILKKRGDVLTPDLSLEILKSMNKAAYSPLIGFKNSAQGVNRIILKSLPENVKEYLCDFKHHPVKGIDVNDTIKLCGENHIRNYSNMMNKQILKLFCNNTDSRESSFYYEAMTSIYTFDEFIEIIWPYYCSYFEDFDEGEFYQSFLKYWIPITVKHYKSRFYEFIIDKNLNWHLKAYTLLETRKKGFYKSEFDSSVLEFLKYSKTRNIALKILCSFVKKHISPNEFEIQGVKFYLYHYSLFEFPCDVLKSFKQFFSQIFLVCHITLSKNCDADLTVYSDFLTFLYKFCLSHLSNNCEGSAQILSLLWDVASGSSGDLVTGFKIDRENVYEAGMNLYYRKLQRDGFWQKTFLNVLLIEEMENVTKTLKYCPKLINVLTKRYSEVITLNNTDVIQLLEELNHLVCLNSSEKIRVYTDLVISCKRTKSESYENDILKLCNILNNNIGIYDVKNMFTCVLALDMLIIIIKHEDVNLKSIIERCLIFLEKIFDENINCRSSPKESKVLESLINNVIECLTISQKHWPEFKKERLLRHLCKIIQISNMKRPVSLSANFVNYFGASMEDDEDKPVKIKLLDRTLNSLYHNRQSGRIRRNPETRLVIHALCLSDKNLSKPFLVSSVHFMLEVLGNPLASDSTLSSTLHTLEVLVSDNSIHQFTLSFIVDIIKHCIRLFNKNSWIIRNADLQLLKSLIERFLGVSLDENIRPKTIEDLFMLFPELISHFYEILSHDKLDDSAVMVLLFFSESQIKNDFFIKESLGRDFEKFRHLFVNIINNYSNNIGFLAIKAFTSLCPNEKIPFVFSEIVYYIQKNFTQMDKNVFANLLKLLRELYLKYRSVLFRSREELIVTSVNFLINYLKQFDCFYFNLLSLKLYGVDDICDKITSLVTHNIDYQTRIWLKNYVPFVLKEIDFSLLENFLKRILACNLPEFLQIQMLSILVDRCCYHRFPATEIIKILISKLVTLSDDNKFLIMAYAKSILLFYDFARDFSLLSDTIIQIRQDFQTDCIYKMFVYVLALAHCDCRCMDDKVFLRNCVKKFITVGDDVDDDVLFDLSVTMKHLYDIISVDERYDVIKLIFYLLLNESTCFEMCKFMSWLTKSHCSSVLISIVNLLNYDNLSKYVGEERLALKLLMEFYRYICDLPNDLEDSDTYYLIESDSVLPKEYLKAIIIKSLKNCKIRNFMHFCK